jgi:ABC-type enterobactin transport system permease subunit
VTEELDDPPLEAGISVSIARSNWEVLFDESSGLVRVVRDRQIPEKLVEIANGVHLGLSGAMLNSFWRSPKFVE